MRAIHLLRPVLSSPFPSRVGTALSLSTLSILERHQSTPGAPIDWDNRIDLQSRFSLEEKGWKVQVEWKPSAYGVGLFAAEDIPNHTVLRVGQVGDNLLRFETADDLTKFAGDDASKWRYLQDYLWGLYLDTDDQGYPMGNSTRMRVGMWVPGNGLNHNAVPNTVYRVVGETEIHLVALAGIKEGDELWDDYRRHGVAPKWLKEIANAEKLTLNFPDCNDFVEP